MASFDIIPTQLLYLEFLKFEEKETETRYQMLGFDNRNFLLNSGTLFWLFLSWVFVAALLLVVKIIVSLFKARRLKTIYDILSVFLFFNFIIRVLIESYLDLSLTSLLNLQETNWQVSGGSVSACFSALIFSMVLLFPIGILLFLVKNF